MKNISFPSAGHDSCFQIEDQSFWFRIRNKLILYFVKKFACDGLFLDAGGGNGYVTLAIQNNTDLDAVLIEPGVKGCLNAKTRGVRNIRKDVLKNEATAPVANIGFFDVIEHIQNPGEILIESYNLLQADGVLFITVPAYSFLWSQSDIEAGHFTRYTHSKILKLLKSSNFKIKFC